MNVEERMKRAKESSHSKYYLRKRKHWPIEFRSDSQADCQWGGGSRFIGRRSPGDATNWYLSKNIYSDLMFNSSPPPSDYVCSLCRSE
jgi:hypothetical protein